MPPKKRLIQFNTIEEEDDPYQPKPPKESESKKRKPTQDNGEQKQKNATKSSPSGQKSLFDYMRKPGSPKKSYTVDLNDISIEEQLEIERQIQGSVLGFQNLSLNDPIADEIEDFRYTPPQPSQQRRTLPQPQRQQQFTPPQQQQSRDSFDTDKKEPRRQVQREVQFDVPIVLENPQPPGQQKFKPRRSPHPQGIMKKLANQSPPKDLLPDDGLLKGLTIVISGVFAVCNREKLEQLLKDQGAKLTGSVSGKTNVLIVGDRLEDGRQGTQGTKYREATKRGTRIIKEEDLDSWFQETLNKSLDELFDNNVQNLYRKSMSKAKPLTPEIHNQSISLVDQYKPQTLHELVGNKSSIASFYGWLERFHKPEEIEKRKKFIPMKMGAYINVGDIGSKACIISGPPGIGKSSMVRLVAQALDLEIIGNNASDQRNKALVKERLGNLVKNNILKQYQMFNKSFLILMDEVDGMTGSDRGGIGALIEQIKETKIPIVCICNDIEKPKLKSLLPYCYSIKFMNPEIDQVTKRLEYISHSEKLRFDREQLQSIARVFNGDLRQSINFLDFLRNSPGDPKNSIKDKCSLINTFEASKMLLSREGRKNLTYRDLQDLFFIDSDMIPLVVQDSYLEASCKDLKQLSRAADLMCEGDILSKAVRQRQQWGLMPGYALLSTIYPATLVGVEMAFPRFPTWLGKNSTSRKVMRERHIIRNCLSPMTYNCSSPQVMEVLFKVILMHLLEEDTWRTSVILEETRLTPENVKTELMDQVFNPQKIDFYSAVRPQVKTALTKAYNKRHFMSKETKKGNKKIVADRITAENYNPQMGEEAGVVEEVVEPIPSDEEAKQPIQKKRKLNKKNAAKKPAQRSKSKQEESSSDLSGFIASDDDED